MADKWGHWMDRSRGKLKAQMTDYLTAHHLADQMVHSKAHYLVDHLVDLRVDQKVHPWACCWVRQTDTSMAE